MEIPNEFFTVTSFGTLAGSVLMVWVVTSALGNVMPADKSLKYKKYIALVFSLVFAFVAASLVSDKTAVTWFLAFVNGCLIYLTAIGVNSLAVKKASPQRQTTPGPTIAPPSAELRSAHGKFRDPWW